MAIVQPGLPCADDTAHRWIRNRGFTYRDQVQVKPEPHETGTGERHSRAIRKLGFICGKNSGTHAAAPFGASMKGSSKPLTGTRVLVGRARHQASALSAGLKELGAEVIEIPFIEIRPPNSYKPLDSAL